MNVKLHTPKSLKAGSGMASLKQFLLSLFATTVSIILTFGTAAIIDNQKKENEKHQILLMVLCDMKTSLDEIQRADSTIREFVDAQAAFLANPDSFETNGLQLQMYFMQLDYNKTVENIFNSNIESINTIGNINFVDKASDFYRMRDYYNENVVATFSKMIERGITTDYDSLVNARADAETHYFVSASNAKVLERNYRACKMLTNVSDEELEAYYKSRTKIEDAMFDDEEQALLYSLMKNRKAVREKLNKAYEEGKKKRNK